MSDASWPEPALLRHLCRLIVSQYPVPRFTRDELQLANDLASLPLRRRRTPVPEDLSDPETLAARLQAWHRTTGGMLLSFHDALYPPLLRETSRPPLVLFVQGRASLLSERCIGIVGCRAASTEGRAWTRDVASDLARFGVVVVSGLARGIDAAAHEGALHPGGATVAVLGNGNDICYPPEHQALQARIVAAGCTVSELPPGTEPRPWHFPNRNRILAGLSQAVIVVQAEHRSGALITARHALDENREVMAVPGPVQDPRSGGPHALLRAGAALVETAADVLEVLGWSPVGGDAARVLEILQRPASQEEIVAWLGWPAARCLRVLAELELAHALERGPDGRLRRSRETTG